MARQRIGQVLTAMGKLSPIDVNEILAEQSVTRRRFGEIALSWGLCEPRHIWQAWFDQLGEDPESVDLETVGVDAQAAAHMSRPIAERYNAIPIRCFDGYMVVATSNPLDGEATAELRQRLGRSAQFVWASQDQIATAIRAYYPR